MFCCHCDGYFEFGYSLIKTGDGRHICEQCLREFVDECIFKDGIDYVLEQYRDYGHNYK